MNYCRNCKHYNKRVEVPEVVYSRVRVTNKRVDSQRVSIPKKRVTLFGMPLFTLKDIVTQTKSFYFEDICSKNTFVKRDEVGKEVVGTVDGEPVMVDCYEKNKNHRCKEYEKKGWWIK